MLVEPAILSLPTAKSSKASPRSMKAPSPAKAPRSSARAAAIAPASPAARACCPTGSSCRISANPGETFLDRMIALVEGAKRQKTPNEIALDILLAAMTIIFLLACVTLLPFSLYSVKAAGQGTPITVTVLVALLVCLIPTTIGGLLSAIGIAGMDRMIQANVIAISGRAVEAAGDVDVLLLGQDRHDHAGQSAGGRVDPGAGRGAADARRRRPAGVARRRDAGRPQHRRAGQRTLRPAWPKYS